MKNQAKLESPSLPSLKSIISIPLRGIRFIVNWLKAGEAPPETHKKSMAIMTALLLFGFTFLSILVLAITKVAFVGYVRDSYASFAFMSFLTLCPGLYALWVTVCCWRRIDGYDWGMIPFFD